MPFYEYSCQKCGHQFEALQKISDEPLRKCPSCGKLQLKKLVSAASFHLKGQGWYETDFKNKPKATESDAGEAKVKSADKKEATTTAAKTDTKSEKKSKAKPTETK